MKEELQPGSKPDDYLDQLLAKPHEEVADDIIRMLGEMVHGKPGEREQFLASLTIDGTTKIADLPKLEPVQLHSQLVLLHQSLPPQTIFPTSWSDEELYKQQDALGKTRLNSEEFTKAAAWLEGLLDVAPTTPGFDFYIMRDFWRTYRIGVNDAEPNAILQIIKSHGSEQGGFFNPELAVDYERKHWRGFTLNFIRRRQWVEDFVNTPEAKRATSETILRVFAEATDDASLLPDPEDNFLEEIDDVDKTREERKNQTFEEALETEQKVTDAIAEILGKPKLTREQLLKNIGIQDITNEIDLKRRYGRRWIEERYQVYQKGPRLDIRQLKKLPSQRLSEEEVLLISWRADFIKKYGDEP